MRRRLSLIRANRRISPEHRRGKRYGPATNRKTKLWLRGLFDPVLAGQGEAPRRLPEHLFRTNFSGVPVPDRRPDSIAGRSGFVKTISQAYFRDSPGVTACLRRPPPRPPFDNANLAVYNGRHP